MAVRLETEPVVHLIEEAFRPLDCRVELFDHDQKLRIRVITAEGKPVLRVPELLVRRARDPKALRNILERVRSQVGATGVKLAPWRPAKLTLE